MMDLLLETPTEHSGYDEVLAANFERLSHSEGIISSLHVVQFNYTVAPTVQDTFWEGLKHAFGGLMTPLPSEHYQALATEESSPESEPALVDQMRGYQLEVYLMANPEARAAPD